MSVSLVQHYFGTKENLLVGTLDIQSAAMGERIRRRLGGARARPPTTRSSSERSLAAFLPTDDESRAAMLLYHGFAAAALTDESLRGAAFFRNERSLRAFIANQLDLAREAGELADGIDSDIEARGIVALLLGLSLTVLLEPTGLNQAERILDAYLAKISREPAS